MTLDLTARAFAYHTRSKHHPHRLARALGYLDWDTQPEPFRTYQGAPRVQLPLAAGKVKTRYCDLYRKDVVAPAPGSLESLGAFFELALGLTAWKECGGSRWSLRANPSSGNLHPTEGYVVGAERVGLPAGVYHYVSRDHCLERRCSLAAGPTVQLGRLLPEGSLVVGLSSIHWREAWKYGERAFRYCQHDVGHAIATVRYAAAALGWTMHLIDFLGDVRVAALLGLDREEDFAATHRLDREHPDVAMLVCPIRAAGAVERLERCADDLVELLRGGSWAGRPNPLSLSHVEWDVIDDVAEATARPPSGAARRLPEVLLPPVRSACVNPAATIIRQRRSAVALDGTTSMGREQFYAMLDAVLPRPDVPPWDALPWQPRIHLGIFVHRVRDLPPGLYLLERTASVHDLLRGVLGRDARWTRPPDCPEHLRLFCLGETECRRAAASVSCNQEIAADGAFSLGMIAEFRSSLTAEAFSYRRLFWEAGVLGQVLYLEAEAFGLRGTGIGCYFDDAFHQVLGLGDDQLQSMYHFTVGGAVDDPRLVTHPAYS